MTAAATSIMSSATSNNNNNNNNNNEMYKLGLQVGHKFLDDSTAKLIPGLETFMKSLRIYFAVDNHYVKRKMMRVLFSFFCKNWSRSLSSSSSSNNNISNGENHSQQQQQPSSSLSSMKNKYALPIHDDNAPDLYIPFMSLITYVLLCALCYGTAGQFDPSVIMNVTSKCFFTQITEVLLFKIGIYVMMSGNGNSGNGSNNGGGGIGQTQSQEMTIPFLDLFAFTGYKYLALTCNMIIGYTLSVMLGGNVEADNNNTDVVSSSSSYGQKGYYIMFFWTASSISYFMLKTMANNIQKKNNNDYYSNYYQQQQQSMNGGGSGGKDKKREFVILIFALSQFVTLWFLGQTKFLN